MGYDYNNDKRNDNHNNNENSKNNNLGKISIINSGDDIFKFDKLHMDKTTNNKENCNISSNKNFNDLLLEGIKDINSNLLSLHQKEKNSNLEPKEVMELKNLLEKLTQQKNDGILDYDYIANEMKYDFIKRKNQKFKYDIKNEVKNTLIKPILDALKIKDNEIFEMKSQLEDLKKNILENHNTMKKLIDSEVQKSQSKNKELAKQMENYNINIENIINKYDKNFFDINNQMKLTNLTIKNLENKSQKEIEKLQDRIPNEINSIKNQINADIKKKEIEYNSKLDNIFKFSKENCSKIENLRNQFESEIKELKKKIEKCDVEQKQLKIQDENKSKKLKELNEKLISNKSQIDNAIKEIDKINKNSKKNIISIINESFIKFNNIFQKNFYLSKDKAQKELKIKLFSQKNYARVGLMNIGNNCYLNSVLQILKNIPKFIYNFFLMDENSGQFLLSLKNLFLKTCFSKESSLNPKDFKDILGKENKRFSGDNQYDSTIFYISLLNIIQKKLNKPNSNYKKIDMKKYDGKSLEEKFNVWKDNYLSKNKTFIIDFFYTFYVSEIECDSCHDIMQSFQCTNFLDFPIISDNNEVKNLEECFYNYQMTKSLKSECSLCKKQKFSQHFTILELPPIIIINLKRVGETKSYLYDIEIPFQLDMEKIIKYTKINSIYELRGFIKHSGDEVSGHNYSFCKNMFDDKWYEYNDSCCIPIDGNPTLDKVFLLCYVKLGSDIQDVSYLKKIMDSLDEKSIFKK